MNVWFEESIEIKCDIARVGSSLEGHAKHFRDIVRLVPGIKRAEIEEQGRDLVTIKTSEGLMKRTRLQKSVGSDRAVVEFDEEYNAGRLLTTSAHFAEEFTTTQDGVLYNLVISELKSPGFSGLIYRWFGAGSIGNGYLKATKRFLES